MKIKSQWVMDGPGPSEVIVNVQTIDGEEELIVDEGLFDGAALQIGEPIRRDSGNVLIQLPRESTSGSMRVWISDSQLAKAFA